MQSSTPTTKLSPERAMEQIRLNGHGKPMILGAHAALAFAYACLGLWPIGLMLFGLALVYVSGLVLAEPRLHAMASGGAPVRAMNRLFALRCFWNVGAPLIILGGVGLATTLEVSLFSTFVLLGYFSVDLTRTGGHSRAFHAYLTGPLAGLCIMALMLVADSAARGGGAWMGLLLGYLLIAQTIAMVWRGTSASMLRLRKLRDKERELVISLTRASQETAATQERLEAVLKGGETGAWEMDLVSRQSTPSPFLTQLFGKALTYENMRSGEALDMTHPDDRERVRAMFRRLHRGPASSETIEHKVFLADGSIGHVYTVGQSFADEDGSIQKIALSTTNITARRHQELELASMVAQAEAALARRRNLLSAIQPSFEAAAVDKPSPDDATDRLDSEALRARLAQVLSEIDVRDLALVRAVEAVRTAQQKAEEASLAKSQFLANMSHELRTPLNAVIGYSEIVTEDLTASGLTHSLPDIARIHGAGKHLLSLITEILDLSKIEAGTLEVHAEPCDAVALAREALETITVMATRQGNVCELIMETADTSLVTDPGRLKQCLLNLLSNAAKFTENGRITLTVRGCMVGDGLGLEFEVRDTGIGISAENMERLFQPFVQVDGSRSRRAGGAGIGLVITRRLAQLLGGNVRVTSTPGVGSIFTLTVRPMLQDDDAVWIAA
jgi:signal transduction histidine kinase